MWIIKEDYIKDYDLIPRFKASPSFEDNYYLLVYQTREYDIYLGHNWGNDNSYLVTEEDSHNKSNGWIVRLQHDYATCDKQNEPYDDFVIVLEYMKELYRNRKIVLPKDHPRTNELRDRASNVDD